MMHDGYEYTKNDEKRMIFKNHVNNMCNDRNLSHTYLCRCDMR